MFDKDDNVIGKGSYYSFGGNIQIIWYKYMPDAGNIQFHSLAEAMLAKHVSKIEWKN